MIEMFGSILLKVIDVNARYIAFKKHEERGRSSFYNTFLYLH